MTQPSGKIVNKTAAPEEYTNIQWLVRRSPPANKAKVAFQVKVK